jgi:hypothetical protein
VVDDVEKVLDKPGRVLDNRGEDPPPDERIEVQAPGGLDPPSCALVGHFRQRRGEKRGWKEVSPEIGNSVKGFPRKISGKLDIIIALLVIGR